MVSTPSSAFVPARCPVAPLTRGGMRIRGGRIFGGFAYLKILHVECLCILSPLIVISLTLCRLIILLYIQNTQPHCLLVFDVAMERPGFMLIAGPVQVTSLLPRWELSGSHPLHPEPRKGGPGVRLSSFIVSGSGRFSDCHHVVSPGKSSLYYYYFYVSIAFFSGIIYRQTLELLDPFSSFLILLSSSFSSSAFLFDFSGQVSQRYLPTFLLDF